MRAEGARYTGAGVLITQIHGALSGHIAYWAGLQTYVVIDGENRSQVEPREEVLG